jgi:hypothetical protein
VSAPEELRRRFRPVLEHLISLEMRNNKWLDAQRKGLEMERDEMNRSQYTMRQLQGSYGAGAGRA